ncbi:DNA primase [Anaerococcus hydrogenalis]|uniref:DNA primase n=1 Tax=Anaerococcus hydrogenalis TaxID=33029 RepID=A0A2N6UJ40_9FIRM|nr:DNA primase [Anaerococcus hydrogenalis]MBS5989545.1 DNA primase [Anaerococcus hydrogenalis]MDK7695844.1 DNA primase [Anaerococcus hydrogenalis]MDK7697590.1 DNA primase [Anaerococcus hydrogenalis]MDK7708871.1 DNA primase [Anaerococcus hydrogenalis]PMC81748.1 DNA primase [Anaerococcus hydrogenalis]
MVFISDDKKNEILENSDIVAIIGDYVDLKKSGNSYKGLCPFHNEKTPSFTVDDKKQLFHCFGCGEGGDVVSFIMHKEGLSYIDSMKYLASKAGIKIDDSKSSRENKRLNRLYDINKDIMMYFYKNLLTDKAGQIYLKNRGFRSNIVNTFMLGFAKNSWDDLLSYVKEKDYLLDDIENLGLIKKSQNGKYYDKYRNRLIFPIINHYGKVIGFGGRSIDSTMPKYLNSPESEVFKKRYNLYGLNIFKKQSNKDIILVEGYMDVIGLNNQGIDQAVASLGTSLTNDQAKLLKRYAKNVFICYDEDNAGIKATDRAIEILLDEGIKPNIISLEKGLDPDDFVKKYGRDAFIKKMDEASDVYNYKYNKILDIYASSKENEKFEKLNLFIEFLASIKSDLTREIFVNNVSKLFDIDKSTLKESVLKYNDNYKKTFNKKFSDESSFKKNNKNQSVLLERKKYSIPINELETLRLYLNQRDDYKEFEDFFDQVLVDENILKIKAYIENNGMEKISENFTNEDQFIIDYIKDKSNKIVANELKDKINLENRRKLLKKLRNRD